MYTIEDQVTKIIRPGLVNPDPEKKENYLTRFDLFKTAVGGPSAKGFSVSEIRTSLDFLDKMDKAKVKKKLDITEDEYSLLLNCYTKSVWRIKHRDIVTTEDYLKGLKAN